MSVGRNLSTRETIRLKSEFYTQIRNFFSERDVLEVITSPFRLAPPTDVFLDHFECRAYMDPEVFYMHSSPEYAMKQLIMQGSGDIYQMSQVARGNEYGAWHSKTFTMLEWYRIGKSIACLQDEAISLLQSLLANDQEVIRISYQQSYAQLANISDVHKSSIDELQAYCLQNQVSFEAGWSRDDLLNNIMQVIIEPKIKNHAITLIYDFPASQAALAKTRENQHGNIVADRFEIYCYGVEVGNGYNELTSAKEHIARFQQDQKQRKRIGKPLYNIDDEFLNQLSKLGMPESSGIAMGVDRIFALKLQAKGLLL